MKLRSGLNYNERLNDIDVAVLALCLIENPSLADTEIPDPSEKEINYNMVEGLLKTINNSFAKELVMDRVIGY